MANGYPAEGETYYPEQPRRRRGRRALVILLIVLLVLAGLLVVADRVAAGVAERVVADRINQEMAKQDVRASAPDVTVGGFPFLTQVVGGNYDSVKVVLRDVQGPPQGDTPGVRIPALTVDARNVAASIDTLRTGQGEVTARTVDGTGTISYDSVVALIDRPGVTLREQGGKLAISAPVQVPIINQELTLRGIADLTVVKGEVVINFSELTADDLPNNATIRAFISTFAQQLSVTVPLPPLPFALEVREVRALPNGLAVAATARDVALSEVS
ncbi:LmeA family phospholipid-binding protein [Plantactinospora sp. CA-290183]|uniref:LmeA family phospholipid-binding protein n=1 Tax=Plantactinospora sp. CA-290183 TaxID=3240006 RepID=UPI003D941E7C